MVCKGLNIWNPDIKKKNHEEKKKKMQLRAKQIQLQNFILEKSTQSNSDWKNLSYF